MYEFVFDKSYSKLNRKRFATIRDFPLKPLKIGDRVRVKSPREIFHAEVIGIQFKRLIAIGTLFLRADTDTDSREKALEELQRFYPSLKENDKVIVYTLERKIYWGS